MNKIVVKFIGEIIIGMQETALPELKTVSS